MGGGTVACKSTMAAGNDTRIALRQCDFVDKITHHIRPFGAPSPEGEGFGTVLI
jgi:hypothetical protein